MNDLIEGLKSSLKEENSRYVYADTVVNTFVSAQIKALREDRKLSQQELALLVGTQQSGISRLERADYSTWKIETLRKLARAFHVRLRISFDEFGTLPPDIRGFTKDKLCPRRFEDDPVFKDQAEDRTFEMPDEEALAAHAAMSAPIETEPDLMMVPDLYREWGNSPQAIINPGPPTLRAIRAGANPSNFASGRVFLNDQAKARESSRRYNHKELLHAA